MVNNNIFLEGIYHYQFIGASFLCAKKSAFNLRSFTQERSRNTYKNYTKGYTQRL